MEPACARAAQVRAEFGCDLDPAIAVVLLDYYHLTADEVIDWYAKDQGDIRPAKPTKPTKAEPRTLACAWCGAKFTATQRKSRFCCRDHSQRWHARERRRRGRRSVNS